MCKKDKTPPPEPDKKKPTDKIEMKKNDILKKIPSIDELNKKINISGKIQMPDTSGIMKDIQNYLNELQKTVKNIKRDQIKDFLLKSLTSTKDYIIAMCDPKKLKEMADKQGPPRPMKYPYTFSAKIAQFPLQHYAKNQWIWKYYFISVAVCLPIFYSINKLANSPGNVAKWAEIRRKEAAEHHH